MLLNNYYVFQPFWAFHNGQISETAWQEAFNLAKRKAHHALVAKDTDTILTVVFDRLYTLRNQIIHGGSTHNSSANRQQLKDGCAFLSQCVYLIIAAMLKHPQSKPG
ncbi:hypothetical protein [Stenoxybacter acetivorans]|uniref:hypothetical protein n=1 Tax=Stenoxybacter acetivorans TaxID=422441 RepID=UPI000AB50325|nr:hypothetical protein [Stenoxybacter acetivorans]